MKYKRALAAAALMVSSAAAAKNADNCPASADREKTGLHRGIGGPVANRPWFQIEVAPEIVSQSPLRRDAETTDATAVGLTLGMNRELGCHVVAQFLGSASADVDSDGDSDEGSAIAGSVKIGLRGESSFGLAPFAGYAVERSFDDFFEGDEGTEHTFEIGIAPGWGKRVEYGFEFAPRFVESTEPLSDYVALRLSPELDITVSESWGGLHFDFEAERRWYQDVVPAIGEKRRDRRLAAFGGIQLNKLVERVLRLENANDVVQDALLGVRWSDVNSNVAEEEEHAFKFAPAISLRFGF